MRIETERLIITEFDLTMAEVVHKNSLDEDKTACSCNRPVINYSMY